MKTKSVLWLFALLLLLTSCGRRSRTGFRLEITSDFEPGALQMVRVKVYRDNNASSRPTEVMDLPLGARRPEYAFPIEASIVPRSESDIPRPIRVEVDGFGTRAAPEDASPLVRAVIVTNYVEGQIRVLRMPLLDACRGMGCSSRDETCAGRNRCVSALVPGESLPIYVPDGGTEPPDVLAEAGDSGSDGSADAEVLLDAVAEAGPDATPEASVETSVETAVEAAVETGAEPSLDVVTDIAMPEPMPDVQMDVAVMEVQTDVLPMMDSMDVPAVDVPMDQPQEAAPDVQPDVPVDVAPDVIVDAQDAAMEASVCFPMPVAGLPTCFEGGSALTAGCPVVKDVVMQESVPMMGGSAQVMAAWVEVSSTATRIQMALLSPSPLMVLRSGTTVSLPVTTNITSLRMARGSGGAHTLAWTEVTGSSAIVRMASVDSFNLTAPTFASAPVASATGTAVTVRLSSDQDGPTMGTAARFALCTQVTQPSLGSVNCQEITWDGRTALSSAALMSPSDGTLLATAFEVPMMGGSEGTRMVLTRAGGSFRLRNLQTGALIAEYTPARPMELIAESLSPIFVPQSGGPYGDFTGGMLIAGVYNRGASGFFPVVFLVGARGTSEREFSTSSPGQSSRASFFRTGITYSPIGGSALVLVGHENSQLLLVRFPLAERAPTANIVDLGTREAPGFPLAVSARTPNAAPDYDRAVFLWNEPGGSAASLRTLAVDVRNSMGTLTCP